MNECVARALVEHLKINLESRSVNCDSGQIHTESGSVCVKLDPDNVISESENIMLFHHESEPVNLKSEPDHHESEPSNLVPKPVHTEPVPINLESESLVVKSETLHSESKPDDPVSIPVIVESEFVHEKLETVIVEVKPIDFELKPVALNSETVRSEPNNENIVLKSEHLQNRNRPVHFILDVRENLNEEHVVSVDIVKPALPEQNVSGNKFIPYRPKNRVQPLYFGPAVPHKSFYKPDSKSRRKSSAACEDGFFCCLCRIFAKSLRITFRGDETRVKLVLCIHVLLCPSFISGSYYIFLWGVENSC